MLNMNSISYLRRSKRAKKTKKNAANDRKRKWCNCMLTGHHLKTDSAVLFYHFLRMPPLKDTLTAEKVSRLGKTMQSEQAR